MASSSVVRWLELAPLLGALGCGSEPRPAPARSAPAAKIEIPAAESTREPVLAEEAAPPALAEVREPENVACRLKETAWSTEELRLKDGGAVFGRAIAAPTSMVMPAGEPRAPVAVLDDAQLVVRAVVPKNVKLHARSAITLKGFLIPKAETALAWSGGKSGSLALGVNAKGVLAWPETVIDDVACDSVGLNVAQYSARDSVTKQAKLPEKDVLREGVELAEVAGGPFVARLSQGQSVELVAAKGNYQKILIDHWQFVVFGWVQKSDLGPHMTGAGYGSGRGLMGVRHVRGIGGRRCARDLTLVVEVGSERAKVGLLKRDTIFQTTEPDAGSEPQGPPGRKGREPRFIQVTMPNVRWLALVEGARLLVPEPELKECTAQAQP